MGPEFEPLFIQGHELAVAIDDGAPLANRRLGMGLNRPGSLEQIAAIHHLQPGESACQADQTAAEQQIHR